MPLIASINGATRKVYLDAAAAVGDKLTFHPVTNLYAEYKSLRAADETIRPFNAFMQAEGNKPKGGGKFTPRYLLLLEGTKVVIPDGVEQVVITGELLTDDASDPLDTSLVMGPCIIQYQPAEAEVIQVVVGGMPFTKEELVEAILGDKRSLTLPKYLGL